MFARALSAQFIRRSISVSGVNPVLVNLTYSNCDCRNQDRFYSSYSRSSHRSRVAVALGGVALFTGGILLVSKGKAFNYAHAESKTLPTSNKSTSLPTYSLEEVSKHNTKDSRIWVTYGNGVYDITDFIPLHPGGSEKIMMAAGGSVDPFWMLYGVHKNPNVLAILEQFKIGNLEENDAKEVRSNTSDPYEMEPHRHAALRPSSLKPFNAEPPPSLLSESFYTPIDLFYVRNHLPVPDILEKDYELSISFGNKVHTLTLSEIKKKFPKVTVTAAIMCAGNRRSEMSKVKAVKGLSWGHAAIGNATWSGARLTDVLNYLGYRAHEKDAHVKFEGLDTDVSNVPYGASVPIEKALDPNGDVILAYEMNGETLSRDHGYPIRAVVPGIVGARNVKWLGSITVSSEESDSHWQQNDYKGFSPSVDWDTVDFSKSPAIQELPVISAICSPEDNGTVTRAEDGTLTLKGYAYSGGGRRIVRVDVTADGGKTWHVANIEQEKRNEPRHYGWSLWSANVPIDPNAKQVEIWAKAVDSSYNTQPESFANIWNLRGVLSNAYHRIRVTVSK